MTCRSHEEDFGTTTMTAWWFGNGMRNSAPLPGPPWMGIHYHIVPVRTFCGTLKSGLEEGQRPSVKR